MSCTSSERRVVPETCSNRLVSTDTGLRCEMSHSSYDEVSESHLRPVKVEEIHQLGGLASTQCLVIDSFRLVIEFNLDWHDLDSS